MKLTCTWELRSDTLIIFHLAFLQSVTPLLCLGATHQQASPDSHVTYEQPGWAGHVNQNGADGLSSTTDSKMRKALEPPASRRENDFLTTPRLIPTFSTSSCQPCFLPVLSSLTTASHSQVYTAPSMLPRPDFSSPPLLNIFWGWRPPLVSVTFTEHKAVRGKSGDFRKYWLWTHCQRRDHDIAKPIPPGINKGKKPTHVKVVLLQNLHTVSKDYPLPFQATDISHPLSSICWGSAYIQ